MPHKTASHIFNERIIAGIKALKSALNEGDIVLKRSKVRVGKPPEYTGDDRVSRQFLSSVRGGFKADTDKVVDAVLMCARKIDAHVERRNGTIRVSARG